jgi:uncharacterized protein YcaQ
MTGAPFEIRNRDARRLWLDAQGLSATPTGPLDLAAMIRGLGFVQLDSIRVVSRAHHHILWSRNQNYREPMLDKLMRKERGVFEHFTHDASVIPMEFYSSWRRQFRRLEEKVRGWEWHRGMLDEDGRAGLIASGRKARSAPRRSTRKSKARARCGAVRRTSWRLITCGTLANSRRRTARISPNSTTSPNG